MFLFTFFCFFLLCINNSRLMTIKFLTYRGASLNYNLKQFIIDIIYSLQVTNSYYSVLQKIYNHSMHFTTVSNTLDLCTDNSLIELCNLAKDPNNTLLVLGNIHTNNHISNSILDNDNNPIFCKDTYISVKHIETGRTYHILLDPPSISKNINFNIYFNPICDFVPYLIVPLVL